MYSIEYDIKRFRNRPNGKPYPAWSVERAHKTKRFCNLISQSIGSFDFMLEIEIRSLSFCLENSFPSQAAIRYLNVGVSFLHQSRQTCFPHRDSKTVKERNPRGRVVCNQDYIKPKSAFIIKKYINSRFPCIFYECIYILQETE